MNRMYKNAFAQYRHQWKSALFSSLGVIIASLALVISGHLMQMATNATMKSFKSMGANTLTIFIASPMDVSFAELDHCLEGIPHLKQAYPLSTGHLHQNDIEIPVLGSNADAQSIFKYNITQGRSIHSHDSRPYAIMTSDLKKKFNFTQHEQLLFDEGVIEVLGESEDYELPMMYFYPDGFVFVSSDTFATLFPDIPLNTILIEVDDFENLDTVATAATAAIELQFPEITVNAINPAQLIKMTQGAVMMTKALIYLIVTICTVLGGIGIMNMTIANITSRYTELALRVSFGATIKQIQTMLMVETAILCCISSLIGALLGVVGVKVVAYIMNWTFIFVPTTIINSQIFAVVIGVLASQYPALVIKNIPIADILKGK